MPAELYTIQLPHRRISKSISITHLWPSRWYSRAFCMASWVLQPACLYVIPFRRASALPAASYSRRVAPVTLAVQLMIPFTGLIGNLHSQVYGAC